MPVLVKLQKLVKSFFFFFFVPLFAHGDPWEISVAKDTSYGRSLNPAAVCAVSTP